VAHLVPPKRGEPVIDKNGVPTVRFMEYLERSATLVNDTVTSTETDIDSVNLTTAMIDDLQRQIDNLRLLVN
jgi:hypothetical protein